MEWVIELINSCVFPIAMCIIMAWYTKYMGDKNTSTIDKLSENINTLCNKIDILIEKESDRK